MIENEEIVAIIPARGGSKGIKNKNIKLLAGKPLISYTIEEACKSKYIDRVIVSTDDEKIVEVSLKYGAEVPFLRPKELAQDDTPGIEVILHAIKWLEEKENYKPKYVMCLQCTSPLRRVHHIDKAIEMIKEKQAPALVSVCESEVNPYWMKVMDKNNRLIDFIKTNANFYRRQDLPTIFRLNGAIYIAEREILLERKTWFLEETIGYIMERYSSIDIDDIVDFQFAEFLIKKGISQNE